MNFIGVDLHKKSITVCVMDEKRKVLAGKTLACTQTDEILEFFRQFRPFKVVVEATASYLWFVEARRASGREGRAGQSQEAAGDCREHRSSPWLWPFLTRPRPIAWHASFGRRRSGPR